MRRSQSFVRLFVGFLLSATGVHSCPIELSPPKVVVKYGDPVSVNCSLLTESYGGMGWEAPVGGTGLRKVNHLTWTVDSLTEWDINPVCFLTPKSGQQCSKNANVVLYRPPENITISSSGEFGDRMEAMMDYNLMCDISNIRPTKYFTVKWFKGDQIVYIDNLEDSIKIGEDVRSVFNFTPSRQDNEVTFRCEVHLDLRPEGPQLNLSSKPLGIEVTFGPDIQCTGREELKENETLESHCPVIGNPPPHIKWMKDGKVINASVPLSREDGGVYTVEAEGWSFITKNLVVVVFYPPELTCPMTYVALENAPHNLTCNVTGFPKPDLIWYKDGAEEELSENLTRSDAGQYLVIASNDLSNVSTTVEIIVLYPPSQIVELEDSEVDVGSDMSLKCSSTGNPRPTYFWEYYRTANVIEKSEDGVSLLNIYNVTAENMGSYTCHALNVKGTVTKSARVTVKGVEQECPIKIIPDMMVIPYQSTSPKVTCEPTSTGSGNVEGEIYWEVMGRKTDSSSWVANTHEDWEPRPFCVGKFTGKGTCKKELNFTLYKKPDSVSISLVGNQSNVVEGVQFQLQCHIINVAPVQNLVVLWYRGDETFEPEVKGPLRRMGCMPENSTDCDISAIRFPLSVSSTINITMNRTHNGEEFRCEARLDLGLDMSMSLSSHLNVAVSYGPTINTTKLPETVPVFRGYPEELVCEADGHPPPRIQWLYSSDTVRQESEDKLIVSEAGLYICKATNDVGSTSYEVEVILKEDYLPLIAGFVAVTVVAISVIFCFIYSIYYKNTRMRRYSLKNPKFSTHNGNVAHNGWDLQFPMTKLS